MWGARIVELIGYKFVYDSISLNRWGAPSLNTRTTKTCLNLSNVSKLPVNCANSFWKHVWLTENCILNPPQGTRPRGFSHVVRKQFPLSASIFEVTEASLRSPEYSWRVPKGRHRFIAQYYNLHWRIWIGVLDFQLSVKILAISLRQFWQFWSVNFQSHGDPLPKLNFTNIKLRIPKT